MVRFTALKGISGISIARYGLEYQHEVFVTQILDKASYFTLHWFNFMCSNTNRILKGILVLFAVLLPTGLITAQGSTASQAVTLEVQPVTKLSVSGNPGALIISDAAAGISQMSVQDNSTSYNMTSNLDAVKIVASIDNPMPAGTQLLVNIASTKGASAGLVDISTATSAVNVVTGINKGTELGQSISYVFAASADVGGIPSQTRTITLTLTN